MQEWKGTFNSLQYPALLGCFPVVAGSITVTLPENIGEPWPCRQTSAALKYKSLYRGGETTVWKIEQGGEDSLSFKGQCAESMQTVVFSVASKTDWEINGTYTSKDPNVFGKFRLTTDAPARPIQASSSDALKAEI